MYRNTSLESLFAFKQLIWILNQFVPHPQPLLIAPEQMAAFHIDRHFSLDVPLKHPTSSSVKSNVFFWKWEVLLCSLEIPQFHVCNISASIFADIWHNAQFFLWGLSECMQRTAGRQAGIPFQDVFWQQAMIVQSTLCSGLKLGLEEKFSRFNQLCITRQL